MPNDRVCKKCSLSIEPNVELYTVCEGACACFFHAVCVSLSETDLSVLSSNIVWMCDKCIASFRRVRDGVKPVNPMNTANDDMNNTSIEDEVKELQSKVAGIIDTLAKMVSNSSSTEPPLLHSTPVSSSTLLNGTNTCGTYGENNKTVRQRRCTISDNKFSLLLSNIDASVVEDDIHRMVSQALGMDTLYPDCIDVVKLVSIWKNHLTMDYVSFKIIMHELWKTKAMNPSTWPKNIKFREFVNRHNDTWKPEY